MEYLNATEGYFGKLLNRSSEKAKVDDESEKATVKGMKYKYNVQ